MIAFRAYRILDAGLVVEEQVLLLTPELDFSHRSVCYHDAESIPEQHAAPVPVRVYFARVSKGLSAILESTNLIGRSLQGCTHRSRQARSVRRERFPRFQGVAIVASARLENKPRR
jgi:hypothetical protein